jgi:hypothetical protein
MGKSTQENQISLIPSRPLIDSLAIISAYSQVLEAHQEAFYTRLISWGVSALRLDGRSGGWIKSLIAHQSTLRGQWWEIRQYLPEDAIHALARQLEALVNTIGDREHGGGNMGKDRGSL